MCVESDNTAMTHELAIMGEAICAPARTLPNRWLDELVRIAHIFQK